MRLRLGPGTGLRGSGESLTSAARARIDTTLRAEASLQNGEGAEAAITSTVSGSARVRPLNHITAATFAAAARIISLAQLSGTVSAEPPITGTFSNGYTFRRRIEIAPQTEVETLAHFPIFIGPPILEGEWLRTTANGGEVTSSSGNDIRFEISGLKLDHWLIKYDGDTGKAWVRVRLPNWTTGSRFILWVYTGKSGAAAEQNAAGTFQAARAVRIFPSGTDISGNNRNLTPNNVGTGTINGMTGGVFAASSYARANGPTWAHGLSEHTTEMLVNITNLAEGNLHRIGGTGAGTADFSSWANSAQGLSTGVNIRAGANTGNMQAVSRDPIATGLTVLHLAWKSQEQPVIWRGETQVPATLEGSVRTGTITVDGSDNESVGAGTGSQTTAALGTYAWHISWPKRLSPAWMTISARAQLDPASMMGIGEREVASEGNQSPVALPIKATATAQITLDPVSLARDPDNPSLELNSFGPSQLGATAIIEANRAVYRPGSTAGVDRVPFTISDGQKSSTSLAIITTNGGGVTPPPPNPFALHPDHDANYVHHADNANATTTQLVDGVTMAGGSTVATVGDSAGAEWSKATRSPDMKVTFKLRRTDSTASIPSAQVDAYLILVLGAVGDGTSEHPADLSDWASNTRAHTHNYRDHISGLRITFFYQDSGDGATVHNNHSAAIFRANGTATTLTRVGSQPSGGTSTNTLYDFEISLDATNNRLTVKQTGSGTTWESVFQDSLIGQHVARGNIGWLITAKRTVQISNLVVSDLDRAPPPPPPPPPPGDFYADPNIAGKTAIRVNSTGQLTEELGRINSSTHYILLTSRLSGSYTVNRPGTRAHPLVIAAEIPTDKANFSGRAGFTGKLTLNAQWVWAYGLKLGYDGRFSDNSALLFSADNCFATRCQIDAPRGVEFDSAQFFHIGFNRFTGVTTATADDAAQANIYLRCGAGDRNPDNGHIYYNHFTQDTSTPGEEVHCIYSGPGPPQPDDKKRGEPYDVNINNTIIEYNYIATTRTRGIYMKNAAVAQFNHVKILNRALQTVSYRGQNALRGRIAFNRVEGGEQIGIQSWYHTIIGNILSGGAEIRCYCWCDNSSKPKTLLGGNGAKIIANKGRLVVGSVRADRGFSVKGPVKNVTIEAHDGAIVGDNGAALTFNSSGVLTNGSESQIERATCIKRNTTSETLFPVPTLSDTICGPRGVGKTWAG